MITFDEFNRLIGLPEYNRLEERYVVAWRLCRSLRLRGTDLLEMRQIRPKLRVAPRRCWRRCLV
ncbi:hypothetical protein [Pseudoroseomonas ludipueritiae]|uniref:Uncharacterized protein n=1 Tax=Pseudoroseomonas ludipueritiae TaxID=198093 RepID=A0ABR7RBC9_9PROT|nr:hypothetical protein [Pseudoroseomonas ludipueritiae]MBC9179152.1 hypothetical protein [Pseudoroseomonas ludipueritiae]